MENNQPTSFNPNPQPTASVDGFNQGAARPMQTAPVSPPMTTAQMPQSVMPDTSTMFAPDVPSSVPPVMTMKKSSMSGSLLMSVLVAVVFLVLGGVGGYMYQKSKDKTTINGLNTTITSQKSALASAKTSASLTTGLKSSVDSLTTYDTSLSKIANQLKTTCGKPCATVTIPTAPMLNSDGTLQTAATTTTTTPSTSTTTTTSTSTPSNTSTTSM